MNDDFVDVTGQLVEKAIRLQIARKEIDDQLAEIKDALKDNFEPGTHTFQDDKFYIRVTPNSRIDDKLAREHLQPSVYKELTKSSIDPIRARRALPASVIKKITKNYENKIEFGIN